MSGAATIPKSHPSQAIASLESVSYASLTRSEPQTLSALRRAVVDQGFFYLELDDPAIVPLTHDVMALYAASRDLYKLPVEEKMQYDTKILAKERNYG